MKPTIDLCLLVAVRDVYDRIHYVEKEHMASNRRMLPMYHANGQPVMVNDLGPKVTDWRQALLTRENICPHDRATWTAYRFPDGTPGDYCPICAPMYVEKSA